MAATPPKIVPAILAPTTIQLDQALKRVGGLVNRVQIDVVDGLFADNKSVGPENVHLPNKLKIDVHLMVKQPENYLVRYAQPRVERMVAQVEPVKDQAEFCNRAVSAGFKPGFALDLKTKIDVLDQMVLSRLRMVLVLGVRAGFAGQAFQPMVLEKVRLLCRLRQSVPEYQFLIGIDGGVNANNIGVIAQSGVDEIAVGSYLFRSKSIEKALGQLKKGIKGVQN